ncbi:MAG: hypothetical protein KAX20_05200, partial [Candidatus Omnitrophica bacterium]|nr:hypothetical protein [Candidatus Omnitrophota bacterium]
MRIGKIMIRIMSSLCFILLFSPIALAEDAIAYPTYPCYFLSEEPVLDGKLEESIWDKIPVATGFFLLGSDEYAQKRQTSFKAFYNEEALYLGIVSEEPEPEKIKAVSGDRGPLWREDHIGVYIFPKDAKRYYQFLVNSIGARRSGIASGGAPMDASSYGTQIPLANWQAKIYQGKGYRSLEAKFPFKTLKKRPEVTERWRVNVTRKVVTDAKIRDYDYREWERFTTWSQLWECDHEPESFGSFIFKETPPSSREEITQLESEIDFFYHKYLKEKKKETEKTDIVRTPSLEKADTGKRVLESVRMEDDRVYSRAVLTDKDNPAVYKVRLPDTEPITLTAQMGLRRSSSPIRQREASLCSQGSSGKVSQTAQVIKDRKLESIECDLSSLRGEEVEISLRGENICWTSLEIVSRDKRRSVFDSISTWTEELSNPRFIEDNEFTLVKVFVKGSGLTSPSLTFGEYDSGGGFVLENPFGLAMSKVAGTKDVFSTEVKTSPGHYIEYAISGVHNTFKVPVLWRQKTPYRDKICLNGRWR